MPEVLRSDEWELPELIEHFTAELDGPEAGEWLQQATLAIRARRRDSVYGPWNVSLDLNVISRFDAPTNRMLFHSAQPGETQFGKLHLELAPVVREQLQLPQEPDSKRPRDPRVIDLALLLAHGIDDVRMLVKLLRLGIRSLGDLAEVASADALRRVLMAKTGLSLDLISRLLRPSIQGTKRDADRWMIHGYHFGDSAGSVMADGKVLPAIEWSDDAVIARGPDKVKAIVITDARGTKSDAFTL